MKLIPVKALNKSGSNSSAYVCAVHLFSLTDCCFACVCGFSLSSHLAVHFISPTLHLPKLKSFVFHPLTLSLLVNMPFSVRYHYSGTVLRVSGFSLSSHLAVHFIYSVHLLKLFYISSHRLCICQNTSCLSSFHSTQVFWSACLFLSSTITLEQSALLSLTIFFHGII